MAKHTISFGIDEETYNKITKLPRGYNLSERLRTELIKILDNETIEK